MLEQDWSLTLYAFMQLQDRDRIANLRRRNIDVQRSILTAMAMNDPKMLDGERRAVLDDMRSPGQRKARQSHVDELRADGLALAERIERSGVLDDRRS